MARPGLVAIASKFENLSDPRVDRCKQHWLLDMVTITLCGAICGANRWVDVEKFGVAKRQGFERFLELPTASRRMTRWGASSPDWIRPSF